MRFSMMPFNAVSPKRSEQGENSLRILPPPAVENTEVNSSSTVPLGLAPLPVESSLSSSVNHVAFTLVLAKHADDDSE